jgi:iron complex transport system substrate-binding protein
LGRYRARIFGSGLVQRTGVAVALAVLVAACGEGGRPEVSTAASSPYRATDDVGRSIVLDAPATRIVSLLPATTETLLALGAGDRLVARTEYDEDPAILDRPSVGGGLTPNVERIAALQPDLVIAWEEAGGARLRPRLEALGIPVFAVTTRDTAGIYSTIDALGRLLDISERADGLASSIRSGLEAVRASVVARPPVPVVYMVSLDPPMAAGPQLFIGEMISIAGGANVFHDLIGHSPQVSMEEIVARAPSVILIPSAGTTAEVERRLMATPGWRQLLDSGAVVRVLPPDILHRPGPSVVAAAETLRNAIHPSTVRAP